MGCGQGKADAPATKASAGTAAPAAAAPAPVAPPAGSSASSKPKDMKLRVSSELNRRALVPERMIAIAEVYLINDQDYNKIGSGSFGKVVKAEHRQTQVVRAVKSIAKDDKVEVNRVRNEVHIGKIMAHPNIVKMCETFEDKVCIYIVMELCTGGSVGDVLQKEKILSEKHTLVIVYQLLYAINYMHSNGICHRDVKPDNLLLLNSDPLDTSIVKVADFGLSCQFQPNVDMTIVAGTPAYAAPDVLKGKYDQSCDLWSTGVTLYQLLSGELPFDGKTDQELVDKVKRGNYSFKAQTWQTVSDSAKDLVRGLLAFKQRERLQAKDALQHEGAKRGAPGLKEPAVVKRLVQTLPGFCQETALKRVALQVMAAQVSEVHLAPARRLFMSLDADGDGAVSGEELKKGMVAHGVSEQELSPDFRAAMEVLCPLTYTEFLGMTLELRVIGEEGVLATTFRFLDADGDGFISADDLEKTDLLVQAKGKDLLSELSLRSQ
eukprot:CAMPEP_0178420746 /NCGR_PEP_ID=MMETSP0689_2-20121128/26290_1 /TAXON_ID=160604 /ORGANISM="Amphidinium massartii, Strain CS-259" /LENGTH=491 /DNA_ID=CAMNT_0020042235 /DNA_START=15 /DNA_END=1487 /DNA_ORIENTATION=-